MRILIVCLFALALTTTGAIMCDGTLQFAFQIGFFVSLGGSALLLLSGGVK
jgi:hypothetical protein